MKATEAQKKANKKYRDAHKEELFEKHREYYREYAKQRYLKIASDKEEKAKYNKYYNSLYHRKVEQNNELNLISLVV